MSEVEIKLPKQWVYWAKKAGLKPESSRKSYRRHGRLPYLRGRDRNWRVNCDGVFECSCPLEYFDRWANSRGANMFGFPKTEREFISAVNILIESSRDAR